MPLWSAYPAQAEWYVNYNFGNFAPPRARRVLSHFPTYMRDSTLVQSVSKIIASEISSRQMDQFDEILKSTRPSLVRTPGLPLWEAMLGLPANVGDTVDLKRARVLSKTQRRNRMREVDLARVARRYMAGFIGHTTRTIEESRRIPVDNLSGLYTGQTLYFGPERLTIISVESAVSEVVVNRDVSLTSYSVISEAEVQIVVEHDKYIFNVLLNESEILELDALVIGLEAAKPAHLGFRIIALPIITYSDARFTYGGLDTQENYDDALADYDDAARPYDQVVSGSTITYNGANVIYDGTV